MSIPLQHLRIDSAPVVAHDDAHLAGPMFDLRFDVRRPGMAVGIDYRLTANTVNLVVQPCPQFPLPTFHNHSKSDRRREAQLGRNIGQGLTEGWKVSVSRTQSLNCESSLLEDAVHQLQKIVKSRIRLGIRGQLIHGRL